LGIGDWGLGIGPNPQSPIPNPQSLFHNQFFALSTQKFSSNVVEKCLERGGESILAKFLDEICHKSKILGMPEK
jgi:hypothetical protein